jgi:hypothetical protein
VGWFGSASWLPARLQLPRCNNLDRRRQQKRVRTQVVAAVFVEHSRLCRYGGASAETGDHCPDASIGVNLPTRLSMNARVNEGELRDRGRAQHEGVEIRQAHAPIH